MRRQYKLTIILMAAALSYLDSSSCMILARGGARGGGFRGDYHNNDAYRGDDYDRGDADNYDGSHFNNPDQDLHAGETQNYNWDGARSRTAIDNVNAGHVTGPISTADMTYRGAAVRKGYGYGGLYNRNFWGAHPEAGWAYAHGWGDNWAWGYSDWPALAGFWSMPVNTVPTNYDYGNNITYQNDNVYYGSAPAESAANYYSQAQTLAQSVPVSKEEESTKSDWKTLGVFSMVQGDQTNTTSMFQLAVDKKGAIKGSYYNPLTGESKAVKGAVDKKNMRASWIVGDNKAVVYDTGLNNLMQEQSQMLVHYSGEKTQQWTLVRLQQPKIS
jgi:hypothetical protein